MTEFFEGIESFFDDFAFIPLDYLRDVQLDSWWLANLMNWIFILIGFVALYYWMKQLKKFEDEEKENASHSA